jgi:nucleoside-diphosphate-sugar epimerase
MTESKVVLITGAGGFVGQALCTEAIRHGLHVRGAVRSGCELPAAVEPMIVGAIDEVTDWSEALRGVDIVIHLAARVHMMNDTIADPLAEFRKVNLYGTENLARQAAHAGVKRLVYVSSIKVNGKSSPSPQVEGEQNIFSEKDIPYPQDPYGVSKWEAEQVLHRVAEDTGMETVIVRPPLIYGAGVKGNFAQMMNIVGKRIPLPFASIQNLRSLVYLGNLTDALITCATHPAAAGQTYLISDGEDISTPDLLRQLAIGMGVPSRLFPFPPAMLRLIANLAGKSQQIERLIGSLRIDGDKIRTDLNWIPPFTMQQGLLMTAKWHQTGGT